MQTTLASEFTNTPAAQQAQALLRRCVHCGFCTAVCPTYQLTGDELDGPRGRIYLIKQVLEGAAPTRETQLHLDRCLTCRSCESACPSGVEYGHLIDLGRTLVEGKVSRQPSEAWRRKLLRVGLTSSMLAPLFKPVARAAQALRGALPEDIQAKVPPRRAPGPWPKPLEDKRRARVLVLAGCVEPALAPAIGHATARVLAAAGIQAVFPRGQGCCGALCQHLADPEGARVQMRANLDAWRPYLERGGVDAIISDASGCALMLKDYGHLLADDPRYALLAAQVSTLARDLGEMLPVLTRALKDRVKPPSGMLAYHPPCTLQHGQKLPGLVEKYLIQLGFKLRPAHEEAQMCCGAGGANVVLQPTIATQLRERKLGYLLGPEPEEKPAAIVSANIGCILHLQAGTDVPVRHWVEILDSALT
ncbi:MAG: glycolate oxidase subunit GlcF [Burkholderiaceae bacterium]|jgi:glycolate oxidase iron-sulfur subunit|nr:glycolate oxidase subunit GlcF [Burkholderiaceae bacterium]